MSLHDCRTMGTQAYALTCIKKHNKNRLQFDVTVARPNWGHPRKRQWSS